VEVVEFDRVCAYNSLASTARATPWLLVTESLCIPDDDEEDAFTAVDKPEAGELPVGWASRAREELDGDRDKKSDPWVMRLSPKPKLPLPPPPLLALA
jgi:hypothetical protein